MGGLKVAVVVMLSSVHRNAAGGELSVPVECRLVCAGG